MKGIVGKKIGMARVLDPETKLYTPVTVLQAPACDVLQVKTVAVDGYDAVVLGAFKRKKAFKNVGKQYAFVQELRLDDVATVEKGAQMTVEDFADIEKVKLTGTTKGRGFAGVIKRWNFSRGPETHGSHHHREPGSVGMCSKPGKVLKGKKLPGRYGNDQKTLRDVKVVKVDIENNLIAVKGAVPGSKNSFVFVRGA